MTLRPMVRLATSDVIAVFGCGGVGLSAVMIAAAHGVTSHGP